MTAYRLSDINLLPKDSFGASNIGKSLKWVLVSGRVIVVLTLFAVIIAFGSRFWFDSKLNDINDEISQKQAVVKSFAEVETQMRSILLREGVVNSFMADNFDMGGIFNGLVSATPQSVTFDQIALSKSSIQLDGKAKSEMGFAGLLANLVKNQRVKTVVLGDTKFSQRDGNISFKLSVTLSAKEGSK